MAGAYLFDLRFYMAGPSWPSNPFQYRGKGRIEIGPDSIILRGSRHRSFRLPRRDMQRFGLDQIGNVYASGSDVWFEIFRDEGNLKVGFGTADAAAADRLVALLPDRRTESFVKEQSENEVFHDRIDYWTPSTPVIWALLAANIGIFVLMWWARYRYQALLEGPLRQIFALNPEAAVAILQSNQLIEWGANYGKQTLKGEWWRLFTSMFLHGSIWHLGLNMLALWQVGQLTERIFGSVRFASLYLLAGLAGSLASVLWNHNVNSVGASGAIFGVIGGLLAFISRKNSGVPPTIVKDLRASVIPFLLFSLWMGFIYPHTDNAAHIGGLIGGWLAGHLLARSIHLPECA